MRIKPALTLVELLLAISLIAILSVSALFAFTTSRQNYALKLSADNLANQLTRAHIFARENRDESSWGIRIIDDRNFTLVSRNNTDETRHFQYSLVDPVTFVTLPEVIWFDQVTGETETATAITIESPAGKTRQINVSTFGSVSQL